jgi:hypothetical protein
MQSKLIKIARKSSLFIGTIFLLYACNNTSDNPIAAVDPSLDSLQNILMEVQAVQPPIPGLEVPFTNYTVPVDQGLTFTTKTGTKVSIPANAFIDASGRPIEGDVEVKFREFHRAGDLIASGIVMHEAESGRYMETGGMFEIEGNKNGQEIFVESSKEIKVDLASYNAGDDFNFFELDKRKCHWKDQGKAAKELENKDRKLALIKLEKNKPIRPVKPLSRSKKSKGQYFELDVDYQKFPLLKAYSDVVWKYSGEGVDIEKEAWVFETDWDKIVLNETDKGSYELRLSNDDKTVSTYVQPVLAGKDYQESFDKFKNEALKKYQEIKEKLELRRKNLNFQAEFRRSFSVNGFGVYNCDKWNRTPSLSFIPSISFDDQSGLNETNQDAIIYYMIMQRGKSVIPFKNNGKQRFRMPRVGKKALIALLPKGRVAVYTAQQLEDIQEFKLNRQQQIPLHLQTVDDPIDTADDLSMIVDYALNH